MIFTTDSLQYKIKREGKKVASAIEAFVCPSCNHIKGVTETQSEQQAETHGV